MLPVCMAAFPPVGVPSCHSVSLPAFRRLSVCGCLVCRAPSGGSLLRARCLMYGIKGWRPPWYHNKWLIHHSACARCVKAVQPDGGNHAGRDVQKQANIQPETAKHAHTERQATALLEASRRRLVLDTPSCHPGLRPRPRCRVGVAAAAGYVEAS